MRRARTVLVIACILGGALVPAGAEELMDTLREHEWHISLGVDRRDPVPIVFLTDRGRRGLYLRRFTDGGFWVDILPEPGQLVVLRESAWFYGIEIAPDGATMDRLTGFPLHYRRRDATGGRGYTGVWEVAEHEITLEVRPLEAERWEFLLHFPGDPLSGLRRGTYPFYRAAPGVYRSSQVYSDSAVELTYERATDSIKLTPQFALDDLPAELCDPLRLWPSPAIP